MRIVIVYSLVILGSRIGYCQTVPSGCTPSEKIYKKYKDDADRLALRETYATNSIYKDSTRIQRTLSDNYFRALVAVANAKNLPAADTVITLFEIHTAKPVLNSLIVWADSSLLWMHNLRYKKCPTGEPTLDKLVKTYGLRKSHYSNLLAPHMIVFKTDSNYNLAPVAKRLKQIPGVSNTQTGIVLGDGSDISDSINPLYTELIYSYGWGDCVSGCVYKRRWKFRVYKNCDVEYMGSYGDPLGSGLQLIVKENDNAFRDVRLNPDPVSSKLFVDFANAKKSVVKLTITNATGLVVYSLNKLNTWNDIDLAFLFSGSYSLKLEDGSQQKIFKLIKG